MGDGQQQEKAILIEIVLNVIDNLFFEDGHIELPDGEQQFLD
jgi:hypothetical protein